MTGQIINGYKIIDEIGKGGMATVYKGKNPQGFTRAFKVVRPDRAEHNPILYLRFQREIEILHQLGEHGNIVKALNVHQHNHTTVLEMEFLDGLDFDAYIKSKTQGGIKDKTQLSKICKQILEPLDYAHNLEYEYTDRHGIRCQAKGILHLDIKPNNIFRTRSGFIKLLDFGIAKIVGEEAEIIQGAEKMTMTRSETGESTFKGTLAYSSPEQQAGVSLGVTSDIFSFGKTLHFITTGTDAMSVDCEIAPFDIIIDKCTQQNPKKRFQSCREIIDFINNPDTGPVSTGKCINPVCGKPIEANVKFCPHCGTEQKKTGIGTVVGGLLKKCPKCGIENKTNDPFCRNCGNDFEQKTPTGKECIMKKTCNHCGCKNDDDSKYCRKCGGNISSDSDIDWFKVIPSIIFIVGIICGLAAIFGDDASTPLFQKKYNTGGGNFIVRFMVGVLGVPLWVLGIMAIIAGIWFLYMTWSEDWYEDDSPWTWLLYLLAGGSMLLVVLKAFSIL